MPSAFSYFDISPVNRRAFLLGAILTTLGCQRSSNRIVVYCAQDREFAEEILNSLANGRTISTKFDTEAQKSVSLYEEIVREKDHPRCDVFWNNEILNTIRLQRLGLLETLSANVNGYPEWTRPAHRQWHAFAARARVLLINRKLVPKSDFPQSILDLTDARWKGRLAMAKPQFGTSATQAACLWTVLGKDRTQEFYRGLRTNNVAILAGNKPVAQAVSTGQYAIGLTDSDDALGEVDQPVEIVLPDRHGHPQNSKLGTLLIPNTLCIIRGTAHVEAAQQLVNDLLQPSVEARLASGPSFHIPLCSQPSANHPLPAIKEIKSMDVDWEATADGWDEVQSFLRQEFARN